MRAAPLLGALLWLLAQAGPGQSAAEPSPPDARLQHALALLESDPAAGRAALDALLATLQPQGDSALQLRTLQHRCEAALADPVAADLQRADRGVAMARTLHDDAALAALLVCRGYLHESGGAIERALPDYQASAVLARRLGDQGALGQAQVLVGEALHFHGRYAEALEAMQEAYRLYVATGNSRKQRYVLNAIANLYADAHVGDYARALDYYQQLLVANRADGAAAEIATTEFNIASTLERQGQLAAALEHFQTALSEVAKTDDAGEQASTRRALANVLLKLDRAGAALPLLDSALATFQAQGNAAGVAHVRLTRGSAYAALGRRDAALADLDAAERWYIEHDNPRFLERIHQVRADLLARNGEWQQAYTDRMAALALGEQLAAQLRDEQTARLRTQFDSERRDQENSALRRQQELTAQALAASDRVRVLQTVLIGLALVILVVFGLLLGKLRRRNAQLRSSNQSLAQSRADVVRSGERAELIFKALTEGLAGAVLDGKYQIQARIGAGGFGTVYRALWLDLGTLVAVKVFKPIAGQDAAASINRFRAEGVSGFRVQHPNAVRVLDFAVSHDAVAYLVMEFLDGVSLQDALRQHGALPWPRVLKILHPICEALACAHAAGVVHRDVKPSNILLCQGDDGDEQPRLIDFGIAKVLDRDTPAEVRDLTATGMFMGTPSYMAPERFVDRPCDGRSDVYSLAVVGFEMLSGRRPFEESGEHPVPLSVQHLRHDLPDLRALAPQTPPALVEILAAALAKRPRDRPSATGLASRLGTLLEQLDGSAVVAAAVPRSAAGGGSSAAARGADPATALDDLPTQAFVADTGHAPPASA